MVKHARILAVVCIFTFLMSCSATTVVYRKDGAIVNGRVTRSDASNIYLVQSGERLPKPILRDDIERIRHPNWDVAWMGVSLAILGAGLTSFIIYRWVTPFDEGAGEGPVGFVLAVGLTVGLATLLGGVGMAGWGFSTHSESKKRTAPPRFAVTPLLIPQAGARPVAGLAGTARF